MKRQILTITVALLLLLVIPTPALAYGPWDVEDPCVAAYEDFIYGKGVDYDPEPDVVQVGFGGQILGGPFTNLYRDEGSGLGLLDEINPLCTLTPERVDLPIIASGWYATMGDASPDTWYWATEPGGYNLPPAPEAHNRYKGLSGVFWVEVFNFSGFDTYKWDEWGSFDRVLAEDVIAYNRVNGLICTLYIPEGTHLSFPGRPYTLVTNLFVEKDDSGQIYFSPRQYGLQPDMHLETCLLRWH